MRYIRYIRLRRRRRERSKAFCRLNDDTMMMVLEGTRRISHYSVKGLDSVMVQEGVELEDVK